jgi:hypothetical protein
MMLIPTGIRAAAKPCRERPATRAMKLPALRAATSEPTVIKMMHTSIISRFPYMSASLATIGVATAAVSSVAVTNQEMSSAETCSRRWNPGSSGMTMVCCSDTVVPASDSTVITAHVGTGFGTAPAMHRRS